MLIAIILMFYQLHDHCALFLSVSFYWKSMCSSTKFTSEASKLTVALGVYSIGVFTKA